MDVSKFLSKVIGLYEVIISLAMLINMPLFTSNIEAMMENGPLMIFIGCMTVIMGILLVVSHNIWQWRWSLLVTIVSWIVLLKGISLLMFPQALDTISLQLITNEHFAYFIAMMDLLIGLVFCYFGFRRNR